KNMAKSESSVAHLFWGTIAVVVSLSFLVGSSEVARPRVLVLVAPPRPLLLPPSIVLDSVSLCDASGDVSFTCVCRIMRFHGVSHRRFTGLIHRYSFQGKAGANVGCPPLFLGIKNPAQWRAGCVVWWLVIRCRKRLDLGLSAWSLRFSSH